MKVKLNFLWSVCIVILFIFNGLALELANAQERTAAFVKVGRYWHVVYDESWQAEASVSSGWFPADYNVTTESEGMASGGYAIELMMRGWNDIEKPIFANISVENPLGTVIEPLKSYVRYDFPENSVNFEDVRQSPFGDTNPSGLIGTSDQTLTVTSKYACDVEKKRKILAWSQQNHDNYSIVDMEFTNVGNVTHNEFYIYMQQRANTAGYANGDNPSVDEPDDQAWWHYFGGRETEMDSARIFYRYSADDPRIDGDDMGWPVVSQNGRLLRGESQFYAILHASKESYTDPANDVNDPIQPRITHTGQVTGGHKMNIDAPNEWDFNLGPTAEAQPMDNIPPGTKHRINNDEQGSPDWTNLGDGYFHGAQATYVAHIALIGPYTFKPGESIHVVYCAGTAGLSLPVCKEIGAKWYNNSCEAPPNLPNPTTGFFPENFAYPVGATQNDINKDLWVSTAIDSVHQTVRRAKWNFEHNFQVPQAPPPPNVSITGYPEFTEVKWSCPAVESMDNFAGYRIMRRVSNLDTAFFEIIHTTTEKANEHIYKDTAVKFGASYYYYVQSAVKVAENDMNALPEQRGKRLWSGRMWLPTPQWVEPPHFSTDDMTQIRIVPNPYNINDPLLEGYGWPDFRGIMFFNVPGKVTIKIFTEDGDLVQTVEHDSPVLAGSLRWDMLTSSQQVISSGVYIAVFEDDNGGTSFQKFVVVR